MSKSKHSKSSSRWIYECHNDPYIRKLDRDRFRSRSAYKLIELNQRDRLFKIGMSVIELGSAPGGWSQVLANLVGRTGKVFASDIIKMEELPYVNFIQGDFKEASTCNNIMNATKERSVDWVVSDMAHNMSGNRSRDQLESLNLLGFTLSFAINTLKMHGNFLTKAFQGEGIEEYIKDLRRHFKKVVIRKPHASRSRSREIYIIGFRKLQHSLL